MADFNLTSFLSGSNDEPEQPKETPAAPVQDAGSGNDFDLTKFVAANQPKQEAKSGDYGFLDRQRDTLVAETGEEVGKGEALARNILPFIGDEFKTSRSAELIQLQKLYDGSAMKDIESRRKGGVRGDEQAGERKNRNMVMDSVNHSSFMGNSGFGVAWEMIQHAKEQDKKTDEETYFDQMENVAKNAGIDRKAIRQLRASSSTVEEFADKLKGIAEGELKAYATRKKEAQGRLQENEGGTMAKIVNGLITNTGYQGKYLVAGASGFLGLPGLVAQSAEQRALELQTKTYDVDNKGNLVVIHNDDTPEAAAVKGVIGGAWEVGVEKFLENVLGRIYKGAKMIPGVGKVVGAVGDGIAGAAGKMFGAVGAKLSKNPAGKWLVGAAKNYGKYQEYTGINGIPMEMLEEHVQDFADSVGGLNTKGRDYTTFGNETANWWHNKFWNAENNKEIFLGLVGSMAVMGAYSGTRAHHEIQKMRQNKAGFLKTVLDDKTVDGLSDTEVKHLYNLVSSPGFTKDKVERFLKRIKGHSDLVNAINELQEVSTPFFDTDRQAVDETITSGSVKSQFVPPTFDASGEKKVDWQPFVLGDGVRTKRIFDPNTGIAIDRIGGNRMCITNRDGIRIVVDGETEDESFGRAVATADRMSIHNQLLDAKRPAKEAYIKNRIMETAQGGHYVFMKNDADLTKNFPDIAASDEYSPGNPAVTLKDGRVIFILDNIKSAYEANRMILHEAAIHSGLNKMFTTEEKRKFLNGIKDPGIEKYKANIDAQRKYLGIPPMNWESDVGIEEAFAHVWDRRKANPLFSQKVNHLIRNLGRSLKLPVSYNTDDLEVMVDTLQRDLRKPGGKLDETQFDTTNAADSVPYNQGQRDFSGDVADPNAPSGSTEGGVMARNMQRNDRIKASHPHLWQFAMRKFGNDEDAAADYISERLEDEGRRGVSGEMDHAHHALLVAQKMEGREDLAPEDVEILDEHGFTGQVLFRDYGYRRQKDGTWHFVGADANAANPQFAPAAEKKGVEAPVTAVPVKVAKSNRQQKAEYEKKFVESLKTQGGRIQRIPAASIKTGDGRIVQFKEDADPKTGIVPGNELEGEYDERTAGLPVVMHFEDGHYETVTGRHRVHLAKQQGIDINVMVLEHGEEGKPGTVSIAEAEAIDAKANIKDGKGTMKDYIKFFNHSKMTREEAEKEGLLGKKTQGRKAFALYHDATKELTAAVDFDGTADNDAKTITPEQAGIIAMNAPKDGHKLNGAVQRSMRDYCISHPKANGDRLARLTQAKAHQLIQADKRGELKPNDEGQMFLFSDMAADVAATDKLDEIENYKEKRSNEYKKLANRIRDAKNSKTVIGGKSMGSILQISKEAAKELDLIDRATGEVTDDRKRLEDAAQLALGKAFMWTRMELPEAFQDELERDLKIGKYAEQQDLPVQPDTGKPISVKPEPKEAPKPTKQQIIDEFSAATGIPVTMIGADGKVEANSTPAAEAAISGKANTNVAEKPQQTAPKPAPKAETTEDVQKNGTSSPSIQGVDLGDAGDDFDNLGKEMWFDRNLEEHSPEEIQAHNLMVGVKMVKLFASKGYTKFDDFARTFAARIPEAYKVARDYIPGMWLTARIMGTKIDAIDEKDAISTLEAVDAALESSKTEGNDEIQPATASEGTEQANTRPAEGTQGERISAAADELVGVIQRGQPFDRKVLEEIVGRHLGGSVAEGTFDMKEATDILELAVNRYMKNKGSLFSPSANVSKDQAVSVINRVRQVLSVIPTQTTRTVEQTKMQQFSTPPHEAFVAAWVANVNDNDVSLEPSAGIGGLAVFSHIAGAKVILNELSPRRAEILNQLGIASKVYNINAEDLWTMFYPLVSKGEVQRPTVVVMNPPFSNSQRTDKKDTIGIGGKHIEEALNMLAPGGRLVAIVGHGMAHDAESPKVRAWWNKIRAKYQVRADVTVNGSEYAKYGTTYDNDIIVIDKVSPDAAKAPVYGTIQSIDELPAMLEGVRNDRPAVQSTNAQPASVQQGGGGSAEANGNNPVRPAADDTTAGMGERRGGTRLLGRPNARPVRPRPSSDGIGSQADNDIGIGRPGLVGKAVGGRSDSGDNVGSDVVQSSDVAVINASGDGSVETSVREVGNGTFSEYRPSKVRVPDAKPHPTPLVESTAMASVLPPDPTYKPILPKEAIKGGQPSEAQIEQIVYAGQAHEQLLPNGDRRGYFMGDGTGLGKGTEISGVICDNYNHGRRKAVWVSKSTDLRTDAQRDLKAFGMDGELFEFNPKKKGSLTRSHGISFMSYKELSQDVDFDTSGQVVSAKKNKLNNFQNLINWLGKDFDGVIVFDECHQAGNAVATKGKRGGKKASKRGRAVVALQNALPKARILYVSATGATEVSNLSYAVRLGLWGDGTAFRDRDNFIEKVSSGGLSVMEIVARDMKSMGVYMARSLSYEGIVNRKLEHKLTESQTRKYDEFADAWQLVAENVKEALVATGGAKNGSAVAAAMSAFWGGQQRFFNQVLTAMQMPSVIADAKKQLAEGNSVVFQLVNTNEATQEKAIKAQQAAGESVNPEELDLSPRDILINFVEHSFPTMKYVEQENENGDTEWVVAVNPVTGEVAHDPIALEAKERLLTRLRMMKLDNNPLELLLEEFGAENVAEITGRSRRRQPVRNADGEVEIKLVNRTARTREAEIDEFNGGKRRILVFSDAGGTGKSFHADRRFQNQQKRVHYLVQAGWRADSALQGFGRTHRSNEKQPPEYVLCSTDIRGHQRFISTVARRLAQLGSLTAGDRSSAGSGVFSEEDNLENQYAKGAVANLFNSLFHDDRGRFDVVCKNLGFMKLKMDKKTGESKEINTLIDENGGLDPSKIPDVPTFLNRILNCRVSVQNGLFDEFADKMRNAIEAAKDAGKYDPGLEKLQGDSIEELNRTEIWSSGEGTGSTDIVEVGVGKRTKKLDFDTAMRQMSGRAQGRDYYFAVNAKTGKVYGFAETSNTKTDENGIVRTVLRCFSPDGKATNIPDSEVRLDGDRQNFYRILDDEARKTWDKALASIPEIETTKRYFVHGTLLPIWDRLGAEDPRIYRIAPTAGGGSFLGLEIKADKLNDVLRRFGKTPQSVELTPETVLNRIVQDGKAVKLVKDGWELKRSKVNGDYRIELKGPEDRETVYALEREKIGSVEVISYVPRFFIPRTVDGVAEFLNKYPAIPDDGGIANVNGMGVNYMAMTDAERRVAFADKLDLYKSAFEGRGQVGVAYDELMNVIASMSDGELMRQIRDFVQYDQQTESDPIHQMRKMIKRELESRGSWQPGYDSQLAMWYSRDLEEDPEALSAIAIHEANAWRAARGLPEVASKKRTTVKGIVREGKHMASNTDEIDRFIGVSAQTPHGWTAIETNAVQQRRIELENDYDAKTELINQAEIAGNNEQAQKIREARDQVQGMIDTLDRANRFAAREWGLAGLARRFLLNRNGTFAKFSGELRSTVGRQLTPEEEQGAKIRWDAYKDAQGKLEELEVRKASELLKDVLRKQFKREEDLHKVGHAKTLKEIERDYSDAISHLIVHANRNGGVLLGFPDGRKWIDAIRRYHMAAAIESGAKPTVDEMIDLIKADLLSAGVRADSHDIMQIITGHGNTYEADNSELEKAMREQRALMNEYQKWEDMMDEGHLPDKTGLIRDEPTQALREAQKITRELMRDFMAKHPELMLADASKRLKTVQDSLMKRWQNEIEDLQKAIDDGEKIMRAKGVVQYTPEMEAKKRELDAKRKEYREMFPAEPLTHEQKLDRYVKVLSRRLADLEAKRTALENAKTDDERAAILGKRKGEKFDEQAVIDLKDRIAEVKEDIQDIHDLSFPAGTYEEFRAMVERRRRALSKNIERIEAKLNARDFGPQKKEPSAIAKRVANDPEVIEATRIRNAASKCLMQECERYKRSVLPYNAGRALDWFDSLMAAPRVFRTMLDLSATMTQGAALFSSHPVLGYQALVNSIKAFGSEANTDTIMAALMADPDYAEFVEMGGKVYNVSNLDEKGIPEEFRGIAQKLVTIRGKQYGLDDIIGVKASERSFGVFLNCINLSVYKAIKASGGWGPTGPSVAQKKDIALSLNIASGRGYEDKGGRGTWDKVMSAALWAPRFAVSGFKMATGWNVLAPQFRGDITERSYKDRAISSKMAAKEYVRQLSSMAAWTLLATLLLGRKDPEWLEEVLNPLSSNFLNVRVGNTNLSFFGPIKQWWTFMARFITGKSVGQDGVTRNRDRGQTAMRFIRGKLSPLASTVVDLTEGKDFLGNKLVWDRSANGKEVSGWWHVTESLMLPLSGTDVVEAFKENSLANALMLTPFVVTGAAKGTFQLDEYGRTVGPYKELAKAYKLAQKEGRLADVKRLRIDNPVLGHASAIDNQLKRVALTKKQIAAIEKRGEKPGDTLLKRYELEQQQAAELIKKFK